MTTPPIAKKVSAPFTHLGKTYDDPYTWLQDKTNPEVMAYLEAENAYTKAVLAHTESLQATLYDEMRGRIAEDDKSVPTKYGDYEYYSRISEGDQYRVYCRQAVGTEDEQILVDENAIAKDHDYTRVNHFEISPDNRYLAYSVDTTGAWVFTLHVLDMVTGDALIEPIPNVAWSIAWAADSKTLFYTTFDDAHRADRLWRRDITRAKSEAIYHEAEESFTVDISLAESHAYLFLTIDSHTTSEVRYLAADDPTGDFAVIAPREAGIEYSVTHHDDRFFIMTNENAENFKLMATPAKANWDELIAHREDTLLEDVVVFKDYLVIEERHGGFNQLRIASPADMSESKTIAFPEPVYTVGVGGNLEYETTTLRFGYSSLVTPQSTVDYDMATDTWETRKQQAIPSGYDASQYVSERLHATAADGAQVPMSVVYRKGIARDGSAPTVLYGYGSYGYSMEASFSTTRLSLLDRGFVYVIAHIRGGSEMGRRWYEEGRLMHKKNSFTDFIACAEHLIAEGYTSPNKLAITGGSAGGLLVSAVVNMRPDLFQAVGALVPFTNVITAMLSPDLPLTITEYEQWGNPEDEEAFDYMLSYSPYENIAATAYPHIYAKTGLNDLQVPYWDPAKWVARLREMKTDDNTLVLVTNMGAGHGGASGRYDSLRETAELYAFFIDTIIGDA